MPDWRYNVLSTSEAYINTDGVALDPLAASYPRRADRSRPQHTCPYTTIFLGARSHHSPFRQQTQRSDSVEPYADVYSVDRSSNLTDTSSFARYEDCRPQLDDDDDLPQIIDQEDSDLSLQVQKVPYASSPFFISESPQKDIVQSNDVFLVEGSDSDALSSCTCDSFERCEFDCRDFEPFSDTCCCDPLSDGVCSRSPKDVESPENFCERVVDEDCASARSDMDGLDLTLFEPAPADECELDAESRSRPAVSSALCGILHAVPENSTGKSCLICPMASFAEQVCDKLYYCD